MHLRTSTTPPAQDDGLFFRTIIDTLPSDPASLVALVMGLGFVGVILYFGTKSSAPAPPEADHGSDEANAEERERTEGRT